jgi:hypothetical protein
MRTTLSIDDDVLQDVKRYAENRSLALGKAVSELVRRALSTPRPIRVDSVTGLRIFDLPPDSPQITTAEVLELDSDQ